MSQNIESGNTDFSDEELADLLEDKLQAAAGDVISAYGDWKSEAERRAAVITYGAVALVLAEIRGESTSYCPETPAWSSFGRKRLLAYTEESPEGREAAELSPLFSDRHSVMHTIADLVQLSLPQEVDGRELARGIATDEIAIRPA